MSLSTRTRHARKVAKMRAWALVRELVHAREGGACSNCATFSALPDGECHHRQLRSRGGKDDAWNCIWLCRPCHGCVHANPAWSTSRGYLCPSWEEPSGWPVKRNGGWFQPSPDGWLLSAMRVEQEAS